MTDDPRSISSNERAKRYNGDEVQARDEELGPWVTAADALGLEEEIERLCHDIEQLTKAASAEATQVQRLRVALRKLAAEVQGMLAIAKDSMREEAGNTNVQCLELRLRQALEMLSGDESQVDQWVCRCGHINGPTVTLVVTHCSKCESLRGI